MAAPAHFACTLAGQCEPDDEHGYYTQAECEAYCTPTPLPLDVAYTTFEFALEEALRLAPSDRVEVVRQVTNVEVPWEDTRILLRALLTDDLDVLALYPVLYPWAAENAYAADWNLALQEAGTLAALVELERLGYPLTQSTVDIFLAKTSAEELAAYEERYGAIN